MKKIIALAVVLISSAGCGNAVKHSISRDYAQVGPQRAVILPLIWESGADADANEISYLFRKMSADKLRSLNYRTVPLEEIDKLAQENGKDWFEGKAPHEIAGLLKADSVLYIRVKEWDKDTFLTYASLGISAGFELYSANGLKLWNADYSTRESDLSLDKKTMELALHKAYEPRIQRFVDAVFTTIPAGTAEETSRKTYFQWLP